MNTPLSLMVYTRAYFFPIDSLTMISQVLLLSILCSIPNVSKANDFLEIDEKQKLDDDTRLQKLEFLVRSLSRELGVQKESIVSTTTHTTTQGHC